jgi:hypothetical protein
MFAISASWRGIGRTSAQMLAQGDELGTTNHSSPPHSSEGRERGRHELYLLVATARLVATAQRGREREADWSSICAGTQPVTALVTQRGIGPEAESTKLTRPEAESTILTGAEAESKLTGPEAESKSDRTRSRIVKLTGPHPDHSVKVDRTRSRMVKLTGPEAEL